MVTPEIVPVDLREHTQWVCWRTELRDGKETKIPIDPTTGQKARSDDPATWTTFEDALGYASDVDQIDGIGFVFSTEDPFVGIDLDDCRDPETGEIDEWAQDIIERVDSYVEISPSGTGIHLIVRGVIPGERNRRGDIEMYEDLRYFTVTGRPVPGAGSSDGIANCQHELEHIYEQHLGGEEVVESDTEWEVDDEFDGPDLEGAPEDDQELIQRAKQADNGPKFTRLWEGRWKGAYPSHSEADMALCVMLAFWTQKDPNRMDRLFRRSGLMRDKWDAARGNQTYGDMTIRRALRYVPDDEVYDPDHYGSSHGSDSRDDTLSAEGQTRKQSRSSDSGGQEKKGADRDDRPASATAEAKEVTQGVTSAEVRESRDSGTDSEANSGSSDETPKESTESASAQPKDATPPQSQQRDSRGQADTRYPTWYQRELDFYGQVPPYVEKLLRHLRELEMEVDRNEDRIQFWRSRAEQLERRMDHLETQLVDSDVDVTPLGGDAAAQSDDETSSNSSEATSTGRSWNPFS